jgi:hypothetical protein
LANPKPSLLLQINQPRPINGLFFELYVKKFVNGDGSVITLAIDAKNTTFNDYVVYATYDQGSTKGFLYGQIYSQKELDKLTGRTPTDVLMMMMMLYSLKPLEWKALRAK